MVMMQSERDNPVNFFSIPDIAGKGQGPFRTANLTAYALRALRIPRKQDDLRSTIYEELSDCLPNPHRCTSDYCHLIGKFHIALVFRRPGASQDVAYNPKHRQGRRFREFPAPIIST